MIKIYHNPRCSKSRAGVSLLEEFGKDFEIVKYLEDKLTVKELSDIVIKLNIKPIDLVRKNENIWKENYKGKILTDTDILEALAEHPKLIERPIVVINNNAVIGRPTENIKTII